MSDVEFVSRHPPPPSSYPAHSHSPNNGRPGSAHGQSTGAHVRIGRRRSHKMPGANTFLSTADAIRPDRYSSTIIYLFWLALLDAAIPMHAQAGAGSRWFLAAAGSIGEAVRVHRFRLLAPAALIALRPFSA